MTSKNQKNEAEKLPDFDAALWNAAGDYIYQAESSNNSAWDRFKQQVETPKRKLSVFRSQYFRIAASITLVGVVAAAAWYFAAVKTNKIQENILARTAYGEMKTISLPDGSTVVLNSNSTLSVSADFGQKNREVKLQGQAYFEVKRNEKLPFNIAANQVKVSVLGTAFDVCSYAGEEASVSVTHGKVKVHSQHTEKILTKGMAVTTQKGNLLSKQSGEVEWTGGELIFNKAGLSQISDAVFHRTGKKLEFNKDDADRTFTGSFQKSTPAEKIAETLSLALSTKIVVQQ
jgi:ferric-dicitrate binding protein FerR (iron transport regulator)